MTEQAAQIEQTDKKPSFFFEPMASSQEGMRRFVNGFGEVLHIESYVPDFTVGSILGWGPLHAWLDRQRKGTHRIEYLTINGCVTKDGFSTCDARDIKALVGQYFKLNYDKEDGLSSGIVIKPDIDAYLVTINVKQEKEAPAQTYFMMIRGNITGEDLFMLPQDNTWLPDFSGKPMVSGDIIRTLRPFGYDGDKMQVLAQGRASSDGELFRISEIALTLSAAGFKQLKEKAAITNATRDDNEGVFKFYPAENVFSECFDRKLAQDSLLLQALNAYMAKHLGAFFQKAQKQVLKPDNAGRLDEVANAAKRVPSHIVKFLTPEND